MPSPAEVDRLLRAADDLTARAGLGAETSAAVGRALAAARALGDPGRLLHALGRATLNLALERLADGGDVTAVREGAEEVLLLAADLLAAPGGDASRRADAVYRTAQAAQILGATGLGDRWRSIVEELWRTVAPGPADDLDGRRARTVALTAFVGVRLDVDPAGLAPAAAEMVDLQRGLARDTGEPAALIDLTDALGIFARVARALDRPDLMRVALSEQYSLAQLFAGPQVQARLDGIMASLEELHRAAPGVAIVVPGGGAWRTRGSYLDLLDEPAQSTGATGRFAARLAAETRVTAPPGPAPGDHPPADPSVTAEYTGRLHAGVALAAVDRTADADRVLADLADELSLHDRLATGPILDAVRGLWAAALYERAMLLHGLGRAEEAWDLGWLSVVVAVRRHEALTAASPTEREALAAAATHMVDAAAIAAAAGRPEDEAMLLAEATGRCADAADPPLRRILGTALHNRAATMRDRGRPATAAALAGRARTVRRELAGPHDERAMREYANTLLLTAALAIDAADWPAAVDSLTAFGSQLHALRPPPEAMADHAAHLAAAVATGAPALVAAARAAGSWPY
ncbi:hypothetical protein Dvina_24910 [Dactylosporangium vinaceum]|uniref:Uncharacterized protein n=1 Tax=Dactylosporangium vinaceum TaxID=53362 RepID=A0ABV5ME02_9ACTN|nr:hypothetical protein [Dactylosporangium vinaceum]UAC01005.1 hypothetical protein Dvina_24910 [Dactylosporangium vinaceum]